MQCTWRHGGRHICCWTRLFWRVLAPSILRTYLHLSCATCASSASRRTLLTSICSTRPTSATNMLDSFRDRRLGDIAAGIQHPSSTDPNSHGQTKQRKLEKCVVISRCSPPLLAHLNLDFLTSRSMRLWRERLMDLMAEEMECCHGRRKLKT